MCKKVCVWESLQCCLQMNPLREESFERNNRTCSDQRKEWKTLHGRRSEWSKKLRILFSRATEQLDTNKSDWLSDSCSRANFMNGLMYIRSRDQETYNIAFNLLAFSRRKVCRETSFLISKQNIAKPLLYSLLHWQSLGNLSIEVFNFIVISTPKKRDKSWEE